MRWEDRIKIQDTLFELKLRFKKDLEIIGGGEEKGADRMIKNACMEMGINYSEIPPFHKHWTSLCSEPAYKYSRPYNVRDYFIRNKIMVTKSDYIILFVSEKESAIKFILVSICSLLKFSGFT